MNSNFFEIFFIFCGFFIDVSVKIGGFLFVLYLILDHTNLHKSDDEQHGYILKFTNYGSLIQIN